MISKLMDTTTLHVRYKNVISSPFKVNFGSPQGDSVSPIIFTIYLEFALRQLRQTYKKPKVDRLMPPEICYADDVDFISMSSEHIKDIQAKVPIELKDWNLKVNEAKLELTTLKRDDRDQETWRNTKKLGSLLGDHEDLIRRKQLAADAFRRSKTMWGSKHVNAKKRIRIYNACVKPVLTYNSGTWALTQADSNSLDAFHRRQLRAVLGIRYPEIISNDELYRRTGAEPLSLELFHARWRLLGHTLRMTNKVPAKQAMLGYFKMEGAACYQGRPRTTIHTVLSQDLVQMKTAHEARTTAARNVLKKKTMKEAALEKRKVELYDAIPNGLRSIEDLQQLEELAKTRMKWKNLVDDAHTLRRLQWQSQREQMNQHHEH
jgi:hypothetical protein